MRGGTRWEIDGSRDQEATGVESERTHDLIAFCPNKREVTDWGFCDRPQLMAVLVGVEHKEIYLYPLLVQPAVHGLSRFAFRSVMTKIDLRATQPAVHPVDIL